MTYIISFAQLHTTNIASAGGKGANLGELTAAGFPIPAGFVLTTAAYDAFVQTHGLREQIIDLARTVSADDPQSSATAAEHIRVLFLQNVIADALAPEITCAYEQLTQTNGNAVAVRSSATAEDLPTASFAGQQDTFLNIQGDAALLYAVKQCWASLWTARAISYRLRQNIDPAQVSLAVVVQQMISADAAGVMFTANPLNGQREQIGINATWGLGAAIVGGLVTPDSVVVDPATHEILARQTATKTVMTVRTDSGTEEQPVPQAQQQQAVLDDPTAIELARIGAQIEAHYGMPMDIEWAIENSEVFILQARPITSLPPTPLNDVTWEPPTPNTMWARRQIVEHMPAPLSPLFEDLYLQRGLDQSIKALISNMMGETGGIDLDLDTMIPHGFADTINGYAYTTGSFNIDAQVLRAIVKAYLGVFKMFSLPAFDWERGVLPGYQAIIARWDAIDLAAAEDAALLQGIGELAVADSAYWWGSALNLAFSRALDPIFDRLLKSFLVRSALPRPCPGSSAFLRGFASKALDAQADMEAIATMIREAAVLRKLVLHTATNQLIAALAEHPDGQPVLDSIRRYLDEYGHQIYNLDFVDPTQHEDPLPLLLSLKALVENPPAQDVRSRQTRMAAERDALVEQTMRRLNPLSRQLFRWVWRWTKHYGPYREHVMFYMGAAWPTVRTLAAALGQRLTNAGTIATPDDIYYLNSDEIRTAIDARATGQSVLEFVPLAHERRTLRARRKLLTPLPKVPEHARLKIGPINLSIFEPTPSSGVNAGPVLNGYAVSTGRVTAPASVVRSIADFAQMQPGTILVCTTTTPAWTPLFSQATGLVTDVGGALAHGSIVAREYGIPAVMGTGVATERITSGMLLAVDGDAGTVTLLDEVDATAETRMHAHPVVKQRAATKQRATTLAVVLGLIAVFVWWRKRT